MTHQRETATSVTELIPSQKIRSFQIGLVALLLLVLVIDGIDIQLLSLVAPVILEEWSVERSDFGPALAGALIGMSFGSLLGGTLGDRFGRLPTLAISVFAFGGATVLAGLTGSVLEMTLLRILSGVGFGAAAPNAIALATDWLPDRLRPQVTSLLSIGTPAGGMVGASLVIFVLPLWGWRGTFFACGALTVLLALAILVYVKESPSYLIEKGRIEKARVLLRRRLLVDIEAQQVLVAETRNTTEVSRTFLSKANLRLNLGAGTGFFNIALVSYAFVAWTPIMLTSAGFTLDQALTAIFAFNLAAVTAAVAAGFLMSVFGSRLVLSASALLLCLTALLLAVVVEGVAPAPSLHARSASYVLTACAGGFAGAAMAAIYAMMAVGYPVACRAGGLGFGMMLGRAGGILASFGGGYLLDAGQAATVWPFLGVLATSAFVGMASAFISDRHVPAKRRGAA